MCDIKALSSLPAREVLLGQVLSAMMAVPTGLVSALSNIPRKMIMLFKRLKSKKRLLDKSLKKSWAFINIKIFFMIIRYFGG
jgi:hypothetical protein